MAGDEPGRVRGWVLLSVSSLAIAFTFVAASAAANWSPDEMGSVIRVEGGPDGVLWIVQLSDLHFSVHHPQRARDFVRYVGPALAMINPSLVLITGDLTDGKSKDLLTMKQNEEEWKEYEQVIRNVAEGSGLPLRLFYDVRGNHDNFGVPVLGGEHDFYQKYSINGKLNRKGKVQSITLENNGRKHLFVGFDSTADIGLRGPTNLFGRPTDNLLADIDVSLSQWDSVHGSSRPTKITFGHFPLSFSSLSERSKGLQEIFLKHSLAAYLCGHLHTKFGANLKRHHHLLDQQSLTLEHFFQFNMHQHRFPSWNHQNCSGQANGIKEFWEWEMGDWRKSRSMRLLAIDSGQVSFADINFKYGSKSIIILPTFPLDSRFMQRLSSPHEFECRMDTTTHLESIRAMVFSRNLIVSVSAKIFDSHYGNLDVVLDSEMTLQTGQKTRGNMYVVPWNWRAFVDPTPNRYWLRIEVTDVTGDVSFSQLRPFSVNGLTAQVRWTWNEFLVMGLQWASIYYPALRFSFAVAFFLLLIPQAAMVFLKMRFASLDFITVTRRDLLGIIWATLMELYKMSTVSCGLLLYLIYLLLFPWIFGYPLTRDSGMAHMTYSGWVVGNLKGEPEVTGLPDVMVIVLPHFMFVLLPTIVVATALVAERATCRVRFLSSSGKKEDDHCTESKNRTHFRLLRKFLLLLCLAILWKHWKQCRALVKAYEINPFIHSPIYFFAVPAFLFLAIYKTSSIHR